MKKGMKGTRAIAVALSLAMMVCGAIGGTMAWLVDQTDEVKNTFTYGDINIALDETDTGDDDDDPNTNQYEMVPGNTIEKDPKVTVKAGSEACYLFVKLDKSTDPKFDDFMTYEIAEGWTELESGVYYCEVEEKTEAQEFYVLKDNQVKVKGSVTKEMLNALDQDTDGNPLANPAYPTLTITAYAVQKDTNINTAELAWKVAKDPDVNDLSTL